MTIAGTITSKSGTRLALDVDGETWNVDLPKTNTATYKKGESITVSGILANAKNGPVLKARSEQDVTPLPKADTKQSVPNITATESTEPKQTLAIVLILLSSLAFIGLKLRPRFYAFTQSYGRKPSFPPRA
jgi:DNA/RNA endonuclease YhcR with UshA esterase domain